MQSSLLDNGYLESTSFSSDHSHTPSPNPSPKEEKHESPIVHGFQLGCQKDSKESDGKSASKQPRKESISEDIPPSKRTPSPND